VAAFLQFICWCKLFAKNLLLSGAFCVFCGDWSSRLPGHFDSKHSDKKEVRKYLAETDKGRQAILFEELKNTGNYIHNLKVNISVQ
jgi:hypothetical protein